MANNLFFWFQMGKKQKTNFNNCVKYLLVILFCDMYMYGDFFSSKYHINIKITTKNCHYRIFHSIDQDSHCKARLWRILKIK